MAKKTPIKYWYQVYGFFTSKDGELIQQLIRWLNFPLDHVIVEIGSYLGRSTICMASVSPYRVVAIDPHEGLLQAVLAGKVITKQCKPSFDIYMDNLKKCNMAGKIETIRKKSEEVEWDGRKIVLLFIDGLHCYENVKQDFDRFNRFVVPNGLCVFHDYGVSAYPDVAKFVDSNVIGHGFEMMEKTRTMAVMRKTG